MFDPKALQNSRPLDVHRWSDYAEVDRAVETLFIKLLESRRIRDRDRDSYWKHLKVVVLDLYAAWLTDPSMFVAFARTPNAYRARSRYNALSIAFRPTIGVVDFLIENDYVEYYRGVYYRSRNTEGRQSRMRAAGRLVHLFTREFALSQEMITGCENKEVIILRDSDKKDIPYDDTEQTHLMRSRLRNINQHIRETHLNLHVSDRDWAQLIRQSRDKGERRPADFSRKTLRRIFNQSSFGRGGRFYGGWWQDLPKELRKFIHIDMKPTQEVDFSGYQARMLYHLDGLPFDFKDPYEVEGFSREYAKVAFHTVINADSPVAAEKAVAKKRRETGAVGNAKQLCDALRSIHKPIERHFGSGIGRRLQFLDSQVAEQILLSMLDKGQVVLPIHDSFIVKTKHVRTLEHLMQHVYQTRIAPEGCPIDKKAGELDDIMRAYHQPRARRSMRRGPHESYVEREQSWLDHRGLRPACSSVTSNEKLELPSNPSNGQRQACRARRATARRLPPKGSN